MKTPRLNEQIFQLVLCEKHDELTEEEKQRLTEFRKIKKKLRLCK